MSIPFYQNPTIPVADVCKKQLYKKKNVGELSMYTLPKKSKNKEKRYGIGMYYAGKINLERKNR